MGTSLSIMFSACSRRRRRLAGSGSRVAWAQRSSNSGRFQSQSFWRLLDLYLSVKVEASGPLVEARARTLLQGLALSLERRGISLDTYLQVTGSSGDELVERLRAEARESVAGELVLDAVADQLGVEVSDEELEDELRLRYEDADEAIPELRESGRWEQERESLRLSRALDRVASEVKRIPAELAAAREKLWTPEKERDQSETTLWTPASKE